MMTRRQSEPSFSKRSPRISAKYAFGKTVRLSYAEAIDRATNALAKEGFGILTTIDVAATLQKKLGKSTLPHMILGA